MTRDMEYVYRTFELRDAGAVRRSHTLRTLMDRNVAEHSYGVAMLALMAYRAEGKMPRPELLSAAMVHDLSEIETGDVPAPAKRAHPGLREALHQVTAAWEEARDLRFKLDDEERALLLWCDRMEFALYACEEVTLGNAGFMVYLGRILDWLNEMPPPILPGHGRSGYAAHLHHIVRTRHAGFKRLYAEV